MQQKPSLFSTSTLLVFSVLLLFLFSFAVFRQLSTRSPRSQLAALEGAGSGLIGWWKFDEGSGTTASDSSGTGNNATLVNGPTWTTGKFGGAVAFSGSSDRVTLPASINSTVRASGTYTMSLWFYLNSRNTITLMSVSNGPLDRSGIGIHSSGAVQAGTINGNAFSGGNKYILDADNGKWHHVALVNNAGSLSYYYDNQNIPISSPSYLYVFGNDTSALLGYSNSVGRSMNGYLDDVRVYDRALTTAEVADLYNYSGPPPVDPPPSPPPSSPTPSATPPPPSASPTPSPTPSPSPNPVPPPPEQTEQFITAGTPSGSLPSWQYYGKVTLTTNVLATCKISTNPNTSFNDITDVTASAGGTSHTFPIYSLDSGNSYTYYGYCKDSSNKFSPPYPVTFSVSSDSTSPEIVELSPTFVYFDTAIIQWNTTEPTDTDFEYGTSQSLGRQIAHDYSMAIPHAVTLTNLLPGTTYYYRVTDRDKSGNRVTSSIQTFTTISRSYSKEFYVAKDGSDSNAGTISKPFATIDKAKTSAGTWLTANPSCNGPVMIWIRGGEYYRSANLYLGGGVSSGSGTSNCPIIYSGYANESAVLTGSKDISGFRKVSDPAILSRLSASARNNVYEVSLPDNGITDYGDLLHLRDGSLAPPELIFNGKVMNLARYPNSNADVLRINYFSLSGSDPILGYGSDSRPDSWVNKSDIWTHGWFKYDWSDHHQRVKSFDSANRRITLDSSVTNAAHGYGRYDPCCAGFFYFENILEEIDTPGEYYLDRGTGKIYFYPPSDISKARVQLTQTTDSLVRTYTAVNVYFQNLTFENARGDAFTLIPSFGVAVVNSTIRNMGASAFRVTGGVSSIKTGVFGSHIYDVGSFGVGMGGNRGFAVNNKIHNTGRWKVVEYGGWPISAMGTNSYVAHNEIYDQLNGGIFFSYVVNGIIEYNDVHDVSKLANDMGGIYLWEESIYFRGNMVRYNYVHDYGGFPWLPMSTGIYFDNFSPGSTAYGNVIDTLAPDRASGRPGGAFMIAAGRDNIIENNIVFNSKNGMHLNLWITSAAAYRRTLATALQEPYRTYFPQSTLLSDNFDLIPEGTVISKNIFYNVSSPWNTIYSGFLQYIDQKDNLINIDPKFVNAAGHDFRLQSNSPALAIGFRDIPFDRIGLISSTPDLPPIPTPSPTPTPSHTPTPTSSVTPSPSGSPGPTPTSSVTPAPSGSPTNVVAPPDGYLPPLPEVAKYLKLGSQGPNVIILQNHLIKYRYLAAHLNTGYYGILTAQAVKRYNADLAAKVPVSGPPTASRLASSYRFRSALKLGMKHADVKNLQIFLNDQGFTVATSGAGSKGNETNFFGPATFKALIRFQEVNRDTILKPINETAGTGFFGSLTIKAVNKILTK